MQTLAAIYRFLQLLAHSGHHMARGCCFLHDHPFLGDLYKAYDAAFDLLCERMVGCGDIKDAKARLALDAKAAGYLAKADTEELDEAEDYYNLLLEMEKEICTKIAALSKDKLSQGTMNLLAQLADESEQRQYKLGRILLDADDSKEAKE